MSDYIEREAAREAVWQILNGMGYSEKHNDRLVEEVDAILNDIPAADVRPVVLCRDCEMASPCSDDREMYCTLNHCYKGNTYFCADGRGKNHENN